MNKQTTPEPQGVDVPAKREAISRSNSEPQGRSVSGLDLLREPFKPHQISKLPKPTKAQTDAVRNDFKAGVRCEICGGWHHPKVVHLDYVGHAALTDRLLDCDPEWNWEPVAFDDHGMPAIVNGGMWIRLTVCGVTRLGYGDAAGKQGGDAVKEIIGDALRNAAMRFGAALDLWHKGDLHADEVIEDRPPNHAGEGLAQAWDDAVQDSLPKGATPKQKAAAYAAAIIADLEKMKSINGLDGIWSKRKKYIDTFSGNPDYKEYFDAVVDAYEITKQNITEKEAK